MHSKFASSHRRVLAILLCSSALVEQYAVAEPVADLQLPPGFRIEILADVPNARSMAIDGDSTLFVSSRFGGQVHAVSDYLGDNPEVHLIDEDLRMPNGIAYADGDLYVAEPNRLLRYKNIVSQLDAAEEPEVVADDLPGVKLHSWKYIDFGPDGKLYIAVGAPCNICNEPDYGLILRMDRDGENREVIARGIRNTVGFDWQPGSDELWFTDNNRDMMGDDEPPGELNRMSSEGLNFGFPFCHGIDTVEPEPELAALGDCADSEAPVMELPAHVAPLGMSFYDGIMFPDDYRNQIFIAEHGSWNRSDKIGYRVTLVRLDSSGKQVVNYETFIDGWLDGDEVSGRPVDTLVAPDGSLLVSDDEGGRVYRVSYAGMEKD